MSWFALNEMGWRALMQQIVWRAVRRSRKDEGSHLAGVDLPEQERHAAVEREAERREHEGA